MEELNRTESKVRMASNRADIVKKENVYILVGAIVLAVIFNILFYKKGFGISYPIFVLFFYGVVIFTQRDKIELKLNFGTLLTIPIILLSLTYALFSNWIFKVLNFMIIPILIIAQTLLITNNNYYKWFDARFIFDLLGGMLLRSLLYVSEAFVLLSEISKRKIRSGRASTVTKIIAGLVLSIPLLLVVISLLSSADKVFDYWMENVRYLFINVNIADFIVQMIIGVFISIIAFSYLWSLYYKKEKDFPKAIGECIRIKKIWDPIIVLTVLVSVNLIYVVFTVIQFGYLFGSIGSLLPEGVTYAEYARKGFFELVLVTLINVSILTSIINLTKTENPIISNVIKIMNSCLVACTMVMLLSAHFRMSLYEQEYGFTYLRVFTHAFMLYIFALLVVTLIKVWRENFYLLKSYIVISVIAYLALNYFNVDAFIAKNNIRRYELNSNETIDTYYLRYLSNDAVPYIVKLLESEDEQVVYNIKVGLKYRKSMLTSESYWQTFNLSDYRAKKILDKYDFGE